MFRILSIFLIFAFPSTIFAQDRAVVEYNGEQGYWFKESVGDKILIDLENYKKTKEKLVPALELKIDKYEEKVKLLDSVIKIDDEIIFKKDLIIKDQGDIISYQEEQLLELKDSKGKWYNSKTFWFISGFALSSFLCIGTVITVNKVN
jgi:hypothetical protein